MGERLNFSEAENEIVENLVDDVIFKGLSPTMREALEQCSKHGKLDRCPGGYWVCPSDVPPHCWYAGTPTINALLKRGRLEVTEWKEGRNGRFPVEVKLPEMSDAHCTEGGA